MDQSFSAHISKSERNFFNYFLFKKKHFLSYTCDRELFFSLLQLNRGTGKAYNPLTLYTKSVDTREG